VTPHFSDDKLGKKSCLGTYGKKYSVRMPSSIVTYMPISANCFSNQKDMNAYADGTVMS
jgi:hypothetical protein